MKSYIAKCIIPLTIISFACFTKWWYTLPLDAPDTMFAGFPLPYVCEGWHTSMSLQIFISEFIIDLLVYFSFWYLLIFLINRYVGRITINKITSIGLWSITLLTIIGTSFIAFDTNNIYYVKRPFKIEIIETGYKFIWQQNKRPEYPTDKVKRESFEKH